MFRTHARGSAAFAGRAAGTHPSLFYRRAGGIPNGRSLRGRGARRDLYHHGEAGLDHSELMDAFATVVSLALQHGVPLRVLCDKLCHLRFEPSGWSGNPKIGYAKSLMDYIA